MYRAKAYELPEASRTARGQHVANLLAFQPEERIAQVIQIQSYEDAPYLVLATRNGLVKKSKLTDFDSNRSGGIVAVNLRDNDELVGAVLCSAEEDLLLVSANGQSIRFSATDEALRPMGRATSGVQGMRFNADDRLLSLNVVREGTYLLVATSGGYAKRTAIEEYPVQGRGGKGVLTVMYDRRRGRLVGALIVDDDSELYAITSGGGVIRTAARQVRKAGRQTKGVRLMNLGEGDTLLAIARNAEESADEASRRRGAGVGRLAGDNAASGEPVDQRRLPRPAAGSVRSRGDFTERAGRPQTGRRPEWGRLGRARRCPPRDAARQAGRIPDAGDSPPWQRGAGRAPARTAAPDRTPPPRRGRRARPAVSRPGRTGSSPAPRRRAPARPRHRRRIRATPTPRRRRGDGPPAEAYASELPDLSGPMPRAPQRKPRPTARRRRRARGIRPLGRQPEPRRPRKPGPGVAATARPGAGQHADPPDRSVEHAEGVPAALGGVVLRLDDRGGVPVPRARRHGRVVAS